MQKTLAILLNIIIGILVVSLLVAFGAFLITSIIHLINTGGNLDDLKGVTWTLIKKAGIVIILMLLIMYVYYLLRK